VLKRKAAHSRFEKRFLSATSPVSHAPTPYSLSLDTTAHKKTTFTNSSLSIYAIVGLRETADLSTIEIWSLFRAPGESALCRKAQTFEHGKVIQG